MTTPAPVESKAVDAAPVGGTEEDPTVGRIQVSAQRKRRFYVYVARRQFANRSEITKVIITALGTAIAAAISTAGELEEAKVGKITNVRTFYSPINPNGQRNVARIAIVVERNSEWKPDEADFQRRQPRKEDTAEEDINKKAPEGPAVEATEKPLVPQ